MSVGGKQVSLFFRFQRDFSSVFLTLSIFIPLYLVYHSIDDMIQAVKSKQVDGMLLDRYTASYYQSRNQLQSLVTVKKLELRRDIGVLFNKNRKDLAECLLNFHRSSIWRSVQTITATFKVTFQVIKGNLGLRWPLIWLSFSVFPRFTQCCRTIQLTALK